MPDEYMDAIEPFDYNDLKDFDTMYMAGYMADSYDVDSKQDRGRAERRMKQTAIDQLTSTVNGYTSVMPVRTEVHLVDGAAAYAFLPVWILCTSWNGKNYLFAVNGQSGKITGEMPTDKMLFVRYWLIIALVLFVLAGIALYFAGGGFL